MGGGECYISIQAYTRSLCNKVSPNLLWLLPLTPTLNRDHCTIANSTILVSIYGKRDQGEKEACDKETGRRYSSQSFQLF